MVGRLRGDLLKVGQLKDVRLMDGLLMEGPLVEAFRDHVC
jgi:hypothetical protein